jgi:hypothetical protein
LWTAVWKSTSSDNTSNADEEEEDDWENIPAAEESSIGDHEALVHLELTAQVLNCLRTRVQQQHHTAEVVTDIQEWLKKEDEDDAIVSLIHQLSPTQLRACWQVLELEGCDVSTNEGILILGPASETERQTLQTLHELDTALNTAQERRDALALKVDAYFKQASRLRKQGLSPIPAMKTRQLLAQKLQQDDQIILNLEAAKLSITSAVQQASVLAALKSTTRTLQQLRPDLEHVHEVMNDHQDALEDLQQVQDSLSAPPAVEDDEELLRELEALTMNDCSEETRVAKIESTLVDHHLEFPTAPTHSLSSSYESSSKTEKYGRPAV